MKNETSEEVSKPVINNSSLITAENSSSLQSKFNIHRSKLASLKDKKYSNIAVFENPNREWPKKTTKIPKGGLYITDVTISKFRETDYENKSTLHTTRNHQTYNSTKARNNRNFFKTKSTLPYITNYNQKTDEQTFMEYFKNILNSKTNNDLKPKTVLDKETKKKDKKNQTFRDDKNEYIRKTNEIKRLKYELDLKKGAMESYKENLKNQINSFNSTISNIKAYKEDIENNFIAQYNDGLRFLSRKVYNLKVDSDKQNNKLKRLKNDVTNLKQMIAKKESIIFYVEKWLKLQIFMKEGKKPDDLKSALKKYNGKLIFNSMEELENNLSYKENQNIRLIEKYNKSQREKEKLFPWLFEQEKSYENFKENLLNNINEKENVLHSLKKREKDLIQTITQLKKNEEINNDNTKKISNKYNILNNKGYDNSQMLVNELGIYYKPIKRKNNIYNYIDSIFCCLLSNEISGVSLDATISNELSNINLPNFKRAIIQMNFIEISLNYLMASINKKINSDKNSMQIMEKTCKIIDAYHRMLNVNRNKMEVKKRRDNIIKKVEKKSNKNYFVSRGKIDYNIVLEQKNKEIEKMKNKKHLKNIDIWDFLHDV